MKNGGTRRGVHVFGARPLNNAENTPVASRGRAASASATVLPENGLSVSPSKTVTVDIGATPRTPTKKMTGTRKSSSVSPVTSRNVIEKVSEPASN
jgi:hypothetical protein